MRRMYTEKQLKRMIEEGHIILTSPSGIHFRLNVSDEGVLSTEMDFGGAQAESVEVK